MALSVTTDLVDITNADTAASSGTFYRLNGVSSGNPLAEADAFVQGAGCIANKTGTAVSTVDSGGHFNSTATFDLTNQHLFMWRLIVTAGNMLTRANRGVSIGLTNTATTSTAAWSTTNMKRWNVDGSDTMPISQGWKCYVIDPAGTADESAGTLTLSTVKNIGVMVRQTSPVSTALNNVFVDIIRRGTGITATTSSGADVITLLSIFDVDRTTANAWGVITSSSGLYYGAGRISIGATNQAQVCNFTDADQVFVWRDYPVADTLYNFDLKGAAGFKTTMQWTGSVIRGQAGQVWNITCDTNSDFKAYASSIANLRSGILSSGSVLDGTSVASSGTIDTNGAVIVDCSFSNHTATQLKVDSPAEMASISASSFASGGTGHAIEITTPGSYTFSSLTFLGYGATGTTNAAVYNNSGGAVTVTVSGGNSPTYRNGAGASTSVVSGATVTFTGLPVGTDIVILTAGTSTVLQQVDQHGATSYAWGYAGTPTVDVGFIKPGYVPQYIRNLALSSSDSSIPVSLSVDRNYQ